jgi:hypothetical protein
MLGAQNVKRRSQNEMLTFKWDVLNHLPYSPDLTPSNFHLSPHLKKHLAGKKFDDDDEVQEEVMMWFKGQVADFYDSGTASVLWWLACWPLASKFADSNPAKAVGFFR